MYLLPESEGAEMNTIPLDIQYGIHTFEISQTLTKKQFNTVLNQMYTKSQVAHNTTGRESYTLLDKQMLGITITLYPIRERRTYRVNIKIEPCRILGSDDPTAIYQYAEKSYCKLRKLCDRYLEIFHIPGGINTMKICRCDLTCNLIFKDQEHVDAYLRILKKSHLIPGYRVDKFKNWEKKAKDPICANQHSHCIRCKQASLLCYDKIDQLKMINRCPDWMEYAAILRIEAQLKRPALKRWLERDALENQPAVLKAATNRAGMVIASYLVKLFPCEGTHLRYKDAVSSVQKVKNKTLRNQMLYLIRKVSDAATMDSAAQKFIEYYSDVKEKLLKKVLNRLEKLGVSPITLPNNSSIPHLASLTELARGQCALLD